MPFLCVMIVRRAFFLERFLEDLRYVDALFFSELIEPEGNGNAFLYRTLPFFRGYCELLGNSIAEDSRAVILKMSDYFSWLSRAPKMSFPSR